MGNTHRFRDLTYYLIEAWLFYGTKPSVMRPKTNPSRVVGVCCGLVGRGMAEQGRDLETSSMVSMGNH